MKDIVNKPFKSHWIGGMYISVTVFVALLYIIIYLFAEFNQNSLNLQAVLSIIMVLIFSFILFITASFYITTYKIKDGVLTSWSPFMTIKVKLKDIKSVEKIMVPLYFRFGASFYSGMFYVPNLGWVRSIITNLRDAILITTKDYKHYMITPSNPKEFMKVLK